MVMTASLFQVEGLMFTVCMVSMWKSMLTHFIPPSEIDRDLFPPLLQLFFRTYSYYEDRNSRRAVQRCIRIIFSSDAPPEALEDFVKAVHTETSKPGLAPSNAFVLVEWCSVLLEKLSGTGFWERWGLETLVCNAQALELCAGESSRPNVKRSALVATWRGLRKVFSNDDTREKMIREAVEKLSSKGNQPSAKNSIMLGAVAGVCARKTEARSILSTQKSLFFSFYNREIIGSRTNVPSHIANGLADFFLDFVTEEDLEKEVIPALEKALLRAPEIVLNNLVMLLFQSVSDTVDLSAVFRAKLTKPLLSNIKSTSTTIRQGAFSAFKAAVPKFQDMEAVAKIAEEILIPLKSTKLLSADQKVLHAEILGLLPVSKTTASMVAPALASVAVKETNDAALGAETSALLHYLQWQGHHKVDQDKSVIDALLKGVSEKKVPARRLWTIRLGELLWSSDEETLKSNYFTLAESSISALLEMWKETNANPIAAAQSGLTTSAFVLIAIAHEKLALMSNSKLDAALKKAQISSQALSMEPKPSFLLNPRIYGKLSNDDDFKWFIRALSSLSDDLAPVEPDSAIALGWSQAMIFCICSSSVKPALRKDASHALSRLYVQNAAHISKVILAGLWRWRDSIEFGEKDSAAVASKTENQNLHTVVKSICLSPTEAARLGAKVHESIRKDQMISMLVLSRPELLPHINWIELCLRVDVDPGDLARGSGEKLIQQLRYYTTFNEEVTFLAENYCAYR